MNNSIKRVKVFELKKEQESSKHTVVFSNIEHYKNSSGVWTLVDEKANQVLEVAQKSNIFIELEENSALLLKDYSKENNRETVRKARRLFPFSLDFSILECDNVNAKYARTMAKYRHIAEYYEHLAIYVLDDERANSKDQKERERIEMEYAVDNRAPFWNAWGHQRKMAWEYYGQHNR